MTSRVKGHRALSLTLGWMGLCLKHLLCSARPLSLPQD